MAVLVTLRVPAEALGPARVLTTVRDVRVEFDRIVPGGSDDVAPYVWVEAEEFEAFEADVGGSPAVTDLRLLDDAGDERLYRVEWDPADDGLFECFRRVDAAVVDGRGANRSWTFRVRFPDEASVSAFADDCADCGIDVEPLRIGGEGRREGDGVGLTAPQREALVTAYREGYFEVPRKATLAEIAEALAVSDHAVSERLRRGISRLVVRFVCSESDPSGSASA